MRAPIDSFLFPVSADELKPSGSTLSCLTYKTSVRTVVTALRPPPFPRDTT